MANRTVNIYGMGFADTDGNADVTVVFNGDTVFSGNVASIKNDQLTSLDTYNPDIEGDMIFSFECDSTLIGSFPLQVTVNKGSLVIGGTSINHMKKFVKYITYDAESIANNSYDAASLTAPPDIQERWNNGTSTEADAVWAENNLTKVYVSSGPAQVFEMTDNKMNVFINGVSQSPTVTTPIDQADIHYQMRTGDVFLCDLWISEGMV